MDNELDIVSITETWLTKDYTSSLVELPGFNFFRGDTAGTVRKHGAGLYVSKRISAVLIEQPLPNIVAVLLSALDIYILSVYRPPSYGLEENNQMMQFLREFSLGKELIIMGDFNLPSISWENHGYGVGYVTPVDRGFRDCFAGCGLIQWVKCGTFFPSGNTLDLVLTSEEDRVYDVECAPPLPGCYHCPVLFRIIFQYCETSEEVCEARCWSRGNYGAMSDELFEIDWDYLFGERGASDCYRMFCDIMHAMIAEYVPLRATDRKAGWLARPPGSLKRRRKRAWDRFKELRLLLGRRHADAQEAFRYYRVVNAQYNTYSREHQAGYEEKLVGLLGVAPKAFHSYLRAKKEGCPSVGPLRGADGQLVSSPDEMGEILADAFSSVFLSDDPVNPQNHQRVDASMDVVLVTYDRVLAKLREVNASSSPGPDGIHCQVLKACAQVLALPLSIIFAKSLEESCLPEE